MPFLSRLFKVNKISLANFCGNQKLINVKLKLKLNQQLNKLHMAYHSHIRQESVSDAAHVAVMRCKIKWLAVDKIGKNNYIYNGS